MTDAFQTLAPYRITYISADISAKGVDWGCSSYGRARA